MQDSIKNEPIQITSRIHQAILDPHIDEETFNLICDECTSYNLGGLCTNLINICNARKRITASSQTKLITCISFPFGDLPNKIKINAARWAIEEGVDEIDLVPNYFYLYQGKESIFAEEIAEICNLGIRVRVILDQNRMPAEILSIAIESSIEAGAYGIQNGNGFGPPVTSDQILALKKIANGRCSIKAVGGIKHLNHAIELIKNGSKNIGTTFGLEIMKELKKKNNG